MRQRLLTIAALAFAANVNAQISLNSTSYPSSLTGTDSLMVTTAASAFPSLTFMTNGSWDLSTVTDSSTVIYAYRVNPDTSAATFADSNFYSFSTYSYQGNVQAAITGSGLMEYGVDIDSSTIDLGSGNQIFIPITHSVFSAPHTVIGFTATMGSTWSSNYESDFNFNITYSPLYSNSAGVVKSFITETDSVKGWGKMRVKTATGGASSWFNVLQVAKKTVVVDSFLIDGASPISLVLSALGVTQGQVTTTYEQNYYRLGEVTAFANVQFSDGTYSTPTRATTHTQRLVNTGIANISNEQAVSVYPNPVSGNVITVELPASSGSWSYEMINMNGQVSANGTLQQNGTRANVTLPASVAPGAYTMRVSNNGKQYCVKTIEVTR